MSYLLDTNVVSESIKPRPDTGVVDWLAQSDEDSIYISVVTIAEISDGIERLPPGKKRTLLNQWLHDQLSERFSGRVLSIDATIADACGRLVGRSHRGGRPLELHDAYIAATAEVRGLTLVTRNVTDFQAHVKTIVNPWS